LVVAAVSHRDTSSDLVVLQVPKLPEVASFIMVTCLHQNIDFFSFHMCMQHLQKSPSTRTRSEK
jgi:hypothetical protein